MRNFLQLGMRMKFLEECPEHPSRKQAEEAARRAGYSEKKIPQKIHKFLAWAAERDRQRQPRLPEFFRDPNTGRLSHLTHETQPSVVTDRAPEPAPDARMQLHQAVVAHQTEHAVDYLTALEAVARVSASD